MPATRGRTSHRTSGASKPSTLSRRGFLGATGAVGGVLLFAGAALIDRPARSRLRAEELAGGRVAFAARRSRPGFEIELALALPAVQRPACVTTVLGRASADGPHALDTLEVSLEQGKGAARIVAPVVALDDRERRDEAYQLVAWVIADDGRAHLASDPVEVVVTPFVMGM